MRFSNRPHPLQSSRFWFMILACVAVTAMWKLGMFPGDLSESSDFEEYAELDLSEDLLTDEDPSESATDSSSSPAMTPPPNWASTQSAPAGQSESGVAQHSDHDATESGWWLNEQTSASSPQSAETAAAPPQDEPLTRTASASPFGPANPEFVGAPSSDIERATASTGQASPFPQWDSPEHADETSEVQTASANVEQTGDDVSFVPSTTETSSDLNVGVDFDFSQIDALLNQGDDVGAHRELSKAYWERPELRPALIERIQETARRIYFQPEPHFMEPYVVQPGDTLQSIAHRYDVSWQFLAKLNQVEPTRIRPGQELKVIRGPFSAVVDLSDFEITVHAHGYFVCRFPVGVGRDNSTPIGTFQVDDKLVDPTYYGPDGVIAHDDPTNPLGEHWISIGDSYGIHGTIEPESIGKAESHGCVRLRNSDVAEVYDFLTIGSEIVIRQ